MTVETEVGEFLDPILRVFNAQLRPRLAGQLTTIYLSGAAQMMEWGKTAGGIPIAYEGPPMQDAIKYAERHCAKLVTQMDDETKKRLAKTVSDAIENKRGIPGLRSDLRKEFTDMTTKRADMIARTETADALEQAFMDRSEAMGVTGKEWIATGGCCDICADCAAQGIVAIDFDYIHDGPDPKRPPGHPNCKCALAPAMLEPTAKPPKAEPPTKAKPEPKAKVPKEKPAGEDWAKTLNKKEKESVEIWQRGGYNKIRNAQQTGFTDARTDAVIKDFGKALNKSKPYEGNVYRGIRGLDAKTFNAISKRKEFTWDAYTSSAKTSEAASKFLAGKGKSIMFEIQNKSGVDITSAGLRAFANEQEVLLHMGSKYRVVSQGMQTYTWEGKPMKVLKMVLEEI